MRIALWLTLIALAVALGGIVAYHGELISALFVPRTTAAAVGLDVLLGTATVAAAAAAIAKHRRWMGPATHRRATRPFVTAPLAAFILGMFAYLIAYPTTQWVFYTTIGLTFVLGFLLAMPVAETDAPVALALLNGCSGIAAGAAGFAVNSGFLVMAGAFLAASGFMHVILRRTVKR
jgi:proton-translocating NAD(P)+ transhydrogenase subunit beta